MLEKRGVSWVLALALALVGLVANPTTASAATTITVSAAQDVQAQMALHYGSTASAAGGGTPNYSLLDCVRMGAAASGTTTGAITNTGGVQPTSANNGNTAYYFAGNTVWAGHGRTNTNCPTALNLSQQSSLGFSPATVGSFTPGGIFNLGQMVHKNTGIQLTSGNQYFRGRLNLQFMGMTLSYTYEMNETTGTNAPDTTTFLNQVSDQSFTYNGITYTLIIRGFTAPQSGTTCNATVASLNSVTSVFTTPESATTTGCLYAQIQQVRTLMVRKQVLAPYGAPSSYPAFSFTAGSDVTGSDWGGAFTLTPTGTGAAGQAYKLGNLVTGQTITIGETAPSSADWSFSDLSCVDGSNSSSITGLTVSGASIGFAGDYGTTSAAAAPITCTYTNTYTPHATLTLVKQVTTTGQTGTLAVPADWTLSATGTSSISGASGSTSVTGRSVIAGSYNLAEVGANSTATAGYVPDGNWSCTAGTLSGSTLTLAAGQSATCTIRNKFAVGRLAISKTVTGNGYTGGATKPFTASYTCTSGTATVKSGTVTVYPGATNGTAGAAVTIDAVPAGANCTVTETNAPTGTSTGLVDNSWVWAAPVNPGTVTIPADNTALVNISNANSQQLGSFQIVKAITPLTGVPGAGYSGGAARTFPITYTCTLGGTPVSSGTVDVSTGTPKVISGIPASSTCSVTGEDQAPKAGDFLDPSYAWDGYAASAPVTVAANSTTTVTVTNSFRRDLVTLTLAKVVTGSGYSGSGADFAIAYDCGAPYSGTATVAAGGSQAVTVPAGVACTVSEKAPSAKLLKPGYVWDDPTYAGLANGSIAVPKGGSGTVTVTNPTSIGYGRVQVTKAVDSFGGQVTSGTPFTVRVSCDAAAQDTTDTYSETFTLLWPSAVTALTPYLPVGTSCTVTETDAPTGHDALPNASYAWKAAPDAVTVKVPATEDAKNVTVTNDVKRVHATFTVVKDIVNHTGHGTGGYHFGGSYRCDYNNGEDVRSGSWGVTGQGTAATVDVLVGSVCSVTEDNPGAPVDGDRSYTWSTQTPDPTPVGVDGATATVRNTLNRAEGSFNVAKSVEGGTAGTAFPSGADFSFSYSCTPLSGEGPAVEPISGSFSVNAGDSRAPGEAIPGGSTCTVTEGDDPGTIDPYRWDGVSLSVTGDASNTGQSGRSVTFTTTDDASPVSVRAVNTISAKTGSVRVSKTVTGETDGYTGGSVFPVTLTCDTGAQGTKTVAAGDSVTWDGIPLGSTCSASEGSTTNGLADGSYAWGDPAIGDAVTVTDSGTFGIAIKNPITRVHAGIEIAKIVDVGGFTGIVDPTSEFSGTWSCTYGHDAAVTGTWHGTGSDAGTLATLSGGADHVLVGSDCTVTEDTAFGAPSSDPSFHWDTTPAYHGATVKAGDSNRLTVTNKLLRDTGKVTVTKQLTGETAGYAPSGSFAGFSVTARCYLNDPAENGHLEATAAVKPGDTATLIDGVPFGWTCAVGEGSFPNPTQLRDASYAWDSQSVAFGNGTDTSTVSAGNTAPHVVVTNGIRRVTGHLAITKAFGTGTAGAVQAGTVFSGHYRCTYGSTDYTGTWSVTGDGAATLTGDSEIPFTAGCTATEDAVSDASLLDSSYTWNTPNLGGTVTVLSASEPALLVVTNTAARQWSGLRVTKSYDGPGGAFASGLQVTGTWSCTYRGATVGSGGWSLPAAGGSVVVARPTDTAIPAASTCTVTENSVAADQLTDPSYAWQPVSYAPAGGTVTTAAGDTASVAVTNSTTRVKASFVVTKHLALGNGVDASALEADLTFSGTYRCTHTGDDPVTGAWGPTPADVAWYSPPVLVGSVCTVTGENDPDVPSKTDDSYLWGTPDLGGPATVTPSGQPRSEIAVANPVNRITGSFGVTKVVTGDTEAIAPSALYSFSWTCVAANGNTFPANAPGTFGLTAGSTWNAPDTVPVGSACTVTESTPPAASDPSYAWSTTLDVANATGTGSGRTTSFTLPRGGAPVSVTATNTLTRTKGSFTVSKSADPADGATVLPGQAIHYTVTVTAAQDGFTSDVVVTDALAGVLPAADVTDIAASQGSATLAGTDLVWTVGTVRAGAVLTLTYTATVKAGAVGADLTNTVSATGETAPPACGPACTTVHHTPAWTLSKTSNPATGATVAPGDTITYTLTATNTANGQVSGATATDDLSGLADATVGFSSAELSRVGDTLTWAIPTMARGETRTVTYTAVVKAGADGATLRNTVTPHGAGASCSGGCSTTQKTVKWALAKTSSPASGAVVAPGDTVTYTLTVTNTGPTAVSGASVTDNVADVVDDATLGALPAGLTRSGTTLTWAVPGLAAGASASVSYTAVVRAGASGATLRNVAAPATVGGHCDTCTTTQTTPRWTLAKTSTAGDGATVKPGDLVGYTLTVTNSGPVTLHGATVTDNLTDVLDEAGLVAVPSGATVSGSTLTWAVPDIAAGATATLTYQVRVTGDGATLRNVAAPASTGGTCTSCSTTQYTPKWTLTKSSNPASGGTVAAGDTIAYTLTATNTGPGVVSGATGVDDLSSVLANADLAFTSTQLSLSGKTLTWAIPTLLPGEDASVTYAATVRNTGVTVTNSVTANGAGGNCGACSTSQSTARWSLTKTSDPASGSTVAPGATITYTLTVANEGPVAVTGASVTDNLADVLDDATLGALPAGLTRSGDTLTWALPTIPVSGVASISYPVTVKAGASGATIANTASPVGAGGHCAISCTTTAYTDAWTLTKTSNPADGATVTPGDTITYTLTVRNDGGAVLHGATVNDDLTDVLDDATLGTLPAGASVAGDTLTWAVADVAANGTATLTYTAVVKAGATGARLRNVASPASGGGTCGSSCTTTAHTGAWTLAKAASPASGVVAPGDTITWTLTATNTSSATIAGATATDDLTSVLAAATVTLGSAQLSQAGDILTWAIPTMAPGETKTITYSAVVKSGASGVTIANTAVPVGSGGTCLVCTTGHTTPRWTLAKSSSPASGSVVAPGDPVSYTLTVTNSGPSALTGAQVSDDLSGLVDDAILDTLPAGLTRSGDTLTWAVPTTAPGATASVTYTATVKAGALGATLANTASPASVGGTCTTCTTASWTPRWTLAKTSDAGTTVHPGDTIGYTLTVTNTGPAALTGAGVVDDLADVLDDATLVAVPAGASLTGTTLTWTVPSVAPGATAQLTYRATVTADNATLRNVARPSGTGGTCTTCTTTSNTPGWRLAKTSDPASGSTVAPGDTITWTLSATNTSQVPVTGATATDDLTGVLAGADVTATAPGLTRSGTTLTWTIPTLAAGETKTVTYTAKVSADGAVLANSATPQGQGGTCGPNCSTTSYTARWALEKTTDAASVVAPGDTVHYTLTVTNTGPVALTGARVSDDVSGLVDDATLETLPSGVTRSADTLTWSVPDVPVGGSASVTYAAVVTALGATLHNVATPASAGGHCGTSCSTTQYTPEWSLAKTSSVGPGATVKPGDTVDYTLTVTNTGPATLHGASVHDDLSGVLDDATLQAVPAGATVTGNALAWAVPDVAAGATASLTYRVVVKATAVGATLANTAAPASVGGTCQPNAAACSTVAHTPSWTLAKTSSPASGATVKPGDVITWTLTATNTSDAQITGALALDDLSKVLPYATVAFTSTELSLSGNTLTWAIPVLAKGDTATVTYTATVRAGADGVTVVNSVSPVGAGGSCVGGCATSQSTGAWTVTKTSDAGAQVLPGQAIHYTLTVANTGPVTVSGAIVSDDLTEVLDDALVSDLGPGLTRTGSTLVWSLPDVPAGGHVSVGYTATVAAGSVGDTLTNIASPVTSGGSCASCTTTSATPAWTLAKTSDPASGATVQPGEEISYTLTVTNTGAAALGGASVTDDITDLADDATLGTLPAGLTRTGDTLTWAVPPVAAGGAASVTYTAVVKAAATGATLRNVAAPASSGGSCTSAGTCSTVAHTGSWTLAKSTDRAAGAVLTPGDVITYTLTATNTSGAVVAGARARDDLTGVVDDATVTAASPELSRLGNTLTWAIPTMAPGETKSVSYTAVIAADGATILNTVVPVGTGGTCTTCTTTQYTPKWSLAKSSSPADGSTVRPGDTISYTLAVTNTGPAALTGAQVTDDVTGLVDDATLGTLPAGLLRSGTTLTWSVPAVAPGATVTVTYTATVTARGATLHNVAAPASAGGSCPGTCATTSFTPAWTLAKTSTAAAGATVVPGDVVGYTLTVTNTGPSVLSGASVSDDLSGVLDDATVNAVPAGAALAGTTLAWSVPDVAVGASVTLDYAVTVNAGATGVTLRNVATPTSVGGTCAGSCATEAFTPSWTLSKSSDAPSVVKPGDVITYTLTAHNTSNGVVAGARASDDLASVMDDAAVSATSAGLSLTGTTLTWSIPTLAAGEFVSVTYTATVVADGATITNAVTPVGVGGTCTTCTTTSYSPSWTLEKTSSPADGAVVNPGDLISYTLAVTNTGPATLTAASVTDDLSGLGAATLGTLPSGLSRDGDTLTWAVPPVAPGATATITYPVTVDAGARGATLRNVAAPASAGGSCADSCTTVAHTPAWTLAKTSTVAEGGTVTPGEEVGYTLTVTNTGPATLHGATVADDLTDVLDDATLVSVPAGATLSGGFLTWSVPDVAPGATATLDYAVTVTATGATLRNVATPTSTGGRCDAACATTALTAAWTLAKSSDAPSVVTPGDVITYTLTAHNTSDGVVSGAKALDDLSDVLDDATVAATASGLHLDGTTLTWSIPTLAAGASASVTYTATVTADGATVTNTVSPVGSGGTCLTCSTTSYTPSWTLAKTSDSSGNASLKPGDTITYTLTLHNTGPIVLSGARVSDDASDLVDDATLGDLPAGLTAAGSTLTWAVPDVAVDGTASVQYTATVGTLGARLVNTAAPVTNGGTCLTCSTAAFSPKWSLAKSSDVTDGGVAKPGDTVSYTLTVTNEGLTALAGAQVSDDLSDVLDDATLVALPAGATLDGTTLTWAVPEVGVGASAQLTYQVTLAGDARGATLHNVATPDSVGGACSEDACETTAYTTAWQLTKTSDPGSGATVEPGDVITYTLTVTNTGPVALVGTDVHDNMADLLDDADFTGAVPEGATLIGTQLTWAVPDVPVGGSTQITYSVTVRNGAYGHTLANVAWGDGAVSCALGGLSPVGAPAAGDCATQHYSPSWSLSKTSDAAAVVVPGTDVTYTLRVRNTSKAVVSGALVSDDLSDVLTYATIAALPGSVTLTGTVMTWTVPTLQPGEEATLDYTVTVDEDAYNVAFTNSAVPGDAAGSCADACTVALVTTKGVVDPTHDDDGDDGSTPSGGVDLAYTGADLGLLGVAGVALAAGAGLLVAGRKRKDEEEA